jgi:hypothetical protein
MAHHQVQAPKLKPFPTSVPGLAPDQLQAVAAALERINVAKDARDRAERNWCCLNLLTCGLRHLLPAAVESFRRRLVYFISVCPYRMR